MNTRFGFVRTACALFEVELGNPGVNAGKLLASLEKAVQAEADVVLFPELVLSG